MSEYKFNIGDEVVMADGFCGKIISICECDRCKERGFLEPIVEWDDDNVDWITEWDLYDGFNNYYMIGNYTFGNIHLEDVKQQIAETKSKLRQLEEQRDLLIYLLERQENNLK